MYSRPRSPMPASYTPEPWNSQQNAPAWNVPQNPLQQFPVTEEGGGDPWHQFLPILAKAAGQFMTNQINRGKDIPGMLNRGAPAQNPVAPSTQPGLRGGQPNQMDIGAIIRMLAGQGR